MFTIKRIAALCSFVIGLLGLVLFIYGGATAAPDAATAVQPANSWKGEVALTNTTTAPFGAKRPFVAASDDGGLVVIVFTRQMSSSNSNNDPYYMQSTDNGDSWTAPAAIYTASSADSVRVNAIIDANGEPHAVWKEGTEIYYADYDRWGTNSFTRLSNASEEFAPGASEPDIISSDDQILDVVWSQQINLASSPNIYHRRSTNGGQTWTTPVQINNSGPSSRVPTVAVDQSSNIHVVWEESLQNSGPESAIFYARSTNDGGSWSTPINISAIDGVFGLPTDWSALTPQIAVNGNNIDVFMSALNQKNLTTGREAQAVYRVTCSLTTDCTNVDSDDNPTNWSQGDSTNPVSGQNVGVNDNSPSNINTSVDSLGGCQYLAFFGYLSGNNNEQIKMVNSCNNWSASVENLTENSTRSFNPGLVSAANWWLHLAYERGFDDGSDGIISQIYYRRYISGIYLPIVVKN